MFTMLAHFCSSAQLQISRCFGLPAFRGCTALHKLESPRFQHVQMRVPRMCYGSFNSKFKSLLGDEPFFLERTFDTRRILKISKRPLRWRMDLMEYTLGESLSFDHVAFVRGAVADLVVLTDLIKKGNPQKVQEWLTANSITHVNETYVHKHALKAIAYSLNNPQIANKMVVKESDLSCIRFHFVELRKHPENVQSMYRVKYPGLVTLHIGVVIRHMHNQEETWKQGYKQMRKSAKIHNFEDPERRKYVRENFKEMGLEIGDASKILRKSVANMYRDKRSYYLKFSRAYATNSLDTPVSPWACSYLAFLKKPVEKLIPQWYIEI